MGVMKEWTCDMHGPFESDEPEPRCPRGCDTVHQEFRTPFAIGGRTKFIDQQLQGFADDFGLSDLSNRNGSVMDSIQKQPGAPIWGEMPQVGKEQAGSRNAVAEVLASMNATPDNALGRTKEAVPISQPKPMVAADDHVKVNWKKVAQGENP